MRREHILRREHIYYSGNVHGVGFRYTAMRVATNYNVTGYVRNMPDGRVEVVVEGLPAEIGFFVDDLAVQMAGYIRETQTQSEPVTGEFADFGLRY